MNVEIVVLTTYDEFVLIIYCDVRLDNLMMVVIAHPAAITQPQITSDQSPLPISASSPCHVLDTRPTSLTNRGFNILRKFDQASQAFQLTLFQRRYE